MFKLLVDMEKDSVKIGFISETNEKFISVTYGCIQYIGSYRFLSSSADSLFITFVDINHETLKNLTEEIIGDLFLKIANEIVNLISEDRYDIDSIGALKKDFLYQYENLEEALFKCICEKDPKFLKTEIPDKWNCLSKKLA